MQTRHDLHCGPNFCILELQLADSSRDFTHVPARIVTRLQQRRGTPISHNAAPPLTSAAHTCSNSLAQVPEGNDRLASLLSPALGVQSCWSISSPCCLASLIRRLWDALSPNPRFDLSVQVSWVRQGHVQWQQAQRFQLPLTVLKRPEKPMHHLPNLPFDANATRRRLTKQPTDATGAMCSPAFYLAASVHVRSLWLCH